MVLAECFWWQQKHTANTVVEHTGEDMEGSDFEREIASVTAKYRDIFASMRLVQEAYTKACAEVRLEDRDYYCTEFSHDRTFRKCIQDQKLYLQWFTMQASAAERLTPRLKERYFKLKQQYDRLIQQFGELAQWDFKGRPRDSTLAERVAAQEAQLIAQSYGDRGLQEILGSLSNVGEGQTLFEGFVYGCRVMRCYLKHDELAFKQQELLRFMEERYQHAVGSSGHQGVSLVGLAFPFLLLDTISYQVGKCHHERLVVCEHVPPAPYNLAQRIYWPETLTEEQHRWALEVVSGWALSAGVKPYLREAIQPVEWMADMNHIYQKRYLPFMVEVKSVILESAKEHEVDSRTRALVIQKVLDDVAGLLYGAVRSHAKEASALYRQTLPREVDSGGAEQGKVESEKVSEFHEEPLDESNLPAPWQQPQAGVEDAFEMYEWVRSFQRQLDELPEDKRIIVSLKQKGWSHQAIAEELTFPLHQVDN